MMRPRVWRSRDYWGGSRVPGWWARVGGDSLWFSTHAEAMAWTDARARRRSV